VTFDPTPPAPLEVYHGRFQFKKVMEWFAVAATGWNQAVVWYDNDSKMRWMAGVWNPVDRLLINREPESLLFGRLARRIGDNVTRPEIVILLLILVAINATAIAGYLELKKRAARMRLDPAIRNRDPWLKYYRAAVATLHGRVSARRPDQTPEEFLVMLAGARSVPPEAMDDIVRLFYRGRYGCLPWTPEVARQAHALLAELSEELGKRIIGQTN
jgi:hypothetical protein